MIDWIKIGCNEINPLALNEPWLLTSVASQHLEYTMPHLAGFYFSWRFQMYLKMIFLNSDTWLRPLTCVLSPDEGRRFFFFAKGFTKITMNVNKASNLRHPECLNLAARLEQLDRGSNLIVFVMVFMLGGKFREVQQKNGCVFVFCFFFLWAHNGAKAVDTHYIAQMRSWWTLQPASSVSHARQKQHSMFGPTLRKKKALQRFWRIRPINDINETNDECLHSYRCLVYSVRGGREQVDVRTFKKFVCGTFWWHTDRPCIMKLLREKINK